MSKSSVWFKMTARVRLPEGVSEVEVMSRMNRCLGEALERTYGLDLKGWSVDAVEDPSKVINANAFTSSIVKRGES